MGLPARPPLGTVMVPQDLQSGSVGPSLLISSLLVCTIVALPDPRLSNGFPRYQEPEEDLSLDLLVPDYSQQQIEGIEAMLDDQGDQVQVVRLPLTSSWPSSDYQEDDYLDILPILESEARISPFHKKDSEYLAFQADPSLTNRNLPKNPLIALRKTPSAPTATTSPPTQPTQSSALSASRRGMKEQPMFRPESLEPLGGRRGRLGSSKRSRLRLFHFGPCIVPIPCLLHVVFTCLKQSFSRIHWSVHSATSAIDRLFQIKSICQPRAEHSLLIFRRGNSQDAPLLARRGRGRG